MDFARFDLGRLRHHAHGGAGVRLRKTARKGRTFPGQWANEAILSEKDLRQALNQISCDRVMLLVIALVGRLSRPRERCGASHRRHSAQGSLARCREG
jgi:hypothetical protein